MHVDGAIYGANGAEISVATEMSTCGREHVTVWLSLEELDTFSRILTNNWTRPAEIEGYGPMLPRVDRRTGLVCALSKSKADGGQSGRLHLRATADFFDGASTPLELDVWARHTHKGLSQAGGRLGSTCGVSACSVMREPPAATWATVDQLDLGKDAVHGGQIYVRRGVHVAPGETAPKSPYPELSTVRHSQPIWSIDIVSAYPWALRQALPTCGGLVEVPPERFSLDVDGVSSVTIELRGCAPVLPVRVMGEFGGVKLAWPTLGTWGPAATGYGATWSHAALAAAVQTGARIKEVHRTLAAPSSRWCMGYSYALEDAELHATDRRARESLRKMGRAIWGKLAQGRTRTEWIHRTELEAVKKLRTVVELRKVLGEWLEVETECDDFPRTVNPFAAATAQDLVGVETVDMMRRIQRAGGEIIYVDTDGIIYSGVNPRELTDNVGARAGQWRMKPDYGLPWIAIATAKRYVIPGRVVGAPPTAPQ